MENLESIKRRILALMAKTLQAGCSEEEVISASAKVQGLLHKYQIDLSDIQIKNEKCVKGEYNTSIKTKQPIDYVIMAIGEFTDTKCWMTYNSQNYTVYKYFGFASDVLIAEYITKLLDRAIIFATEAYKDEPFYVLSSASHRKKLKESFGYGMAVRLASRLRAMKAAQRKSDVETTGRDLVVIKFPVVLAEFDKLDVNLRPKSSRSKHINQGAYNSGKSAADKVAINPGVTERQGVTGLIS